MTANSCLESWLGDHKDIQICDVVRRSGGKGNFIPSRRFRNSGFFKHFSVFGLRLPKGMKKERKAADNGKNDYHNEKAFSGHLK